MVTKRAAGSAPALFCRVAEILETARASVARTVNTTQVVANWLIGREIVEEEQSGRRRAGYGEQVVLQLAGQLTAAFGRGWSAQNLFYMKQFYTTYPGLIAAEKILHAVRGESAVRAILHASRGESVALPVAAADWQPGLLHSHLSWTHYRTLLRVDRAEARGFYEVESVRNAWAARELERQINMTGNW